jgi:sulfoxide reductase heme-binding subunit YedZ
MPAAAGAASGTAPLWYTTRATGEVVLALLTATVVLGVAGVTRFATPRWPRLVTSGLHRNLSLMAVAFLAAHILTAVLDTFAPVGWSAVVLPFSSAYRPFWLGLGTLAFDLFLAVLATSLLRARLRYRSWRAVHWAAYAAWPLALWHGLGTGTDGRLPWLLAIDAVCVVSVLAAVLWRLYAAGPAGRRLAVAGASAVFALATIVFVAVGPMRPGWARRAGTPTALLSHPSGQSGGAVGAAARSGGAAGAGGRTAAGSGTPTAPLLTSAPFAGTVAQSGSSQDTTIALTADTHGGPRQHIVITLQGPSGHGGGIALSSGRVSVTVAGGGGGAGLYQGPVTGLDGDLVGAVLTGPGGRRVPIQVRLSISGPRVTGQLEVRPGGEE